MNNIQKAKLLFDLFPEETIAFISFAAEVADKIKKERDTLRTAGGDSILFPAGFWVDLAEDLSKRIRSGDGKLQKSSTVFSEQLFDGDRAFLSKHCLLQYSSGDKLKNTAFRQGVELFFLLGRQPA
ncbi:hypothetical protein BW716_06305 [[Flexibacter] sp. ATCC 35208]|nr:hypothetical protein BW716_06305 [[Flexibacter] sp. ATCC 35208]